MSKQSEFVLESLAYLLAYPLIFLLIFTTLILNLAFDIKLFPQNTASRVEARPVRRMVQLPPPPVPESNSTVSQAPLADVSTPTMPSPNQPLIAEQTFAPPDPAQSSPLLAETASSEITLPQDSSPPGTATQSSFQTPQIIPAAAESPPDTSFFDQLLEEVKQTPP